MDGLRRAGTQDHLPRGLLTRAWLRFLTGARTGPESAQEDLDEAWEIAERGPMRLFMADIHLHRARLFFREAQYPWESPPADLAAAERSSKNAAMEGERRSWETLKRPPAIGRALWNLSIEMGGDFRLRQQRTRGSLNL